MGTLLSILATLAFGVTLTDQYILHFRYDTTGVHTESVTVYNWYRKYVSLNELGYWERELPDIQAEKDDRIRIAVVGDSFAFGQGVKGTEFRFSNQLERPLNEDGISADVYNFGKPGASTASERRIIERDVK